MQRYANYGGNSGVVAFEITDNSITVQFKNGWNYVYDTFQPGPAVVEQMKTFALAGRGLNSYIKLIVKDNFSRKFL